MALLVQAAGLLLAVRVACVPLFLNLRIANACLRRRLPVFKSTAGVLKSSASACAAARTRRSLAHEKLERDRDLENCAAVL